MKYFTLLFSCVGINMAQYLKIFDLEKSNICVDHLGCMCLQHSNLTHCNSFNYLCQARCMGIYQQELMSSLRW